MNLTLEYDKIGVRKRKTEKERINMPFINVKTNASLSIEQEKEIKAKLGETVTLLPGKTENWLMVNIEDDSHLYFRGSSDTVNAIAEVKLFGAASAEDYEKMTEAVCGILKESAGAEEVYVKYEEVRYWGYNGSNF